MQVFQIEGDWGFENLKLSTRPEPVAGRGQVLVAMRMAALNARDLIVPARGYGRATGELPLIPVSDGVGEVVATGEGVTRVAVGDRVCPTYFQNWVSGEPSSTRFSSALGGPLDGVMTELMCLDQNGVVKVPSYLSDAEAATLPCAALTAWSAIATYGQTRAGEQVLIQGTGGVALFALAFAKLHGAHVTVISSSDEKLETVRTMGADATINYREIPDWARASREITRENGGFDKIIELGGEATFPLSLRAIRPGGTISMIGVLSGLKLEASLGPIVARQIRLQGVTVGHRDGFEAMLRAMSQHEVKPVLGDRFAFKDLKAAMAHLREGDNLGKTLIEFGK
ncbi:NAD(P)-dependent alcohol dehydrogenase [Thioclava sp. IC9]|uniref:zinc-dependent alcohol dehydrogenase family protein n=1 Tax=Thioclava sp. IC9 TaxID=1973007 RepID=UPI000B53E547|nr:NAD(P)-dependent alcohol dehydrogenase [Thioclava sp. IC9]OWX98495.1 NAD(P)-dependent alcohol dehydrogenase [Thioclava sp. IC9]